MGLTDPIKGALGVSLQELSRAAEDRAGWTPLVIGSPGVRADSTAHANTQSNGPGL